MNRLEGKALKAYKSEAWPKFLATVDPDGMPNVVPVLTLKAADPATLIFARMMVWKTLSNFQSTGIATSCCFGPGSNYWRVRLEFVEMAKSGPYLEEFNKMALFRYNAYAGVTDVGVFRVKEVLSPRKMRWAGRLLEMRNVRKAASAVARPIADGGPMPPPVIEHFSRRAALKYTARVDEEGWPAPQPVFSLFPAGASALVFKADDELLPEEGQPMAASSITHKLISYQVKGKYRGRMKVSGKTADVLDVTNVYSASPPLPGKSIYPPE